ncbi:MAG: hypothetical protein H6606_04010 [Flavobacteriales bacterium]|nr:hypothetical protein [Flavobacteriales bacterium]
MSIRVRPRFRFYVKQSAKEIEDLFRAKLREESNSYEGQVLNDYIVIRVIQQEQHYWSPQLSVSLSQEDDRTLVRGLYGPNPAVWLLFTFIHIATSVAAVFISIIGFSNMSLGLSSMILWIIPILGLISLIMYLVARAGRKLGESQLIDLHHFFEEHIGEKIFID